MKSKIYITALLVLIISIYSCNESGSSSQVKSNTDCDSGIEKAISDAEKGRYKLRSHGLRYYSDSEFNKSYRSFVLNKYGIEIEIGNESCGIFIAASQDEECYSEKMKTLVLEKFGKDIYEKIKFEAQPHYKNYIEEKIDNGHVFSQMEVDTIPKFVGGQNSLKDFLKHNLKNINTTKDKVYVGFVVEKDGSISAIKTGETNETVNNKLINVLKTMPKWKPGIYLGKPVKVRVYIPIKFQ